MPYNSTVAGYNIAPTIPRVRMRMREEVGFANDLLRPRPAPPAQFGTTLSYFNVTGYCFDVQQPDPTQISAAPQLANVSGFVDFFPGNANGPFPAGFSLIIPNLSHGDGTAGDTLVPLAPITARFLGGSLRTIVVGDPIGVLLLSNAPLLGLPLLRYHVRFRNITYGGNPALVQPNQLTQPASQVLTNFAFDAPNDTTPINLTGVGLVRQPYLGP
jgi:hypothetical protein